MAEEFNLGSYNHHEPTLNMLFQDPGVNNQNPDHDVHSSAAPMVWTHSVAIVDRGRDLKPPQITSRQAEAKEPPNTCICSIAQGRLAPRYHQWKAKVSRDGEMACTESRLFEQSLARQE
jgi:hypothetical protein